MASLNKNTQPNWQKCRSWAKNSIPKWAKRIYRKQGGGGGKVHPRERLEYAE